tara:strand:+ start:208 stop:381 length:174 start_codon:yes stop_codon:yes gene_type:complete
LNTNVLASSANGYVPCASIAVIALSIGAGYQFNDISDDLRQIEGRKEGLFLNIIAKF